MQQGRRTASLKASYDAVNLGIHPTEFSVGRELLSNNELHLAAQQALAATTGSTIGEQKRNKRSIDETFMCSFQKGILRGYWNVSIHLRKSIIIM